MTTPNARTVRSPRGPEMTAKIWAAEAALRMLMNNLDPEVAERPQDLVVYGGIGKAARDWLRTKANSIEGGTSEVQLNIIAKHLLQLPGA